MLFVRLSSSSRALPTRSISSLPRSFPLRKVPSRTSSFPLSVPRSSPASQRPITCRRAIVRMSANSDEKTKVLFVCLGNICRSPSAEAVFRAVVEKNGLKDKYEIDSCGTGGGSSNWYKKGGFSYHEGDPADPRMTRTALKRGIKLTSYSRPLRPRDLTKWDLIIGMDGSNIEDILFASNHWISTNAAEDLPDMETVKAKVKKMTSFAKGKFKGSEEVPDPYYGGDEGFELVLDLLDDACSGLLQDIEEGRAVQSKGKA